MHRRARGKGQERPGSAIPGRLVAILAVAGIAAGLYLAPEPMRDATMAEASALAQRGLQQLSFAIARGLVNSPEMIIGLGTALLLPVVALAGLFARFVLRLGGRKPPPQVREAALSHRTSPNARAWLAIDGAGGRQPGNAAGSPLELKGEIIRIGSGEDNDVPLKGAAPLHALIQRTPEAEFIIMDVSSATGGGLMVNGERHASWRLRNGDRIELGKAALTFHRMMPANRAAPAAHP